MPVRVQRLEDAPTFRAMLPEQREKLTGLLEYCHFHAGELICEQGDVGDTMYFIEKGEVTFFAKEAGGVLKELRTLVAGDFFGEIALLNNTPRSVTAQAKTEVFALELRRDNFDAFLLAHPDMAVRMLRVMAKWLKDNADMMGDMITPSTKKDLDALRTTTEKRIERLVGLFSNPVFLLGNLLVFMLWIIANELHHPPWDSREFGFLGLFAAIEALAMTMLVLAKQKRDETDANRRNDLILEKVQTSPDEIKTLRAEVRALTAVIRGQQKP